MLNLVVIRACCKSSAMMMGIRVLLTVKQSSALFWNLCDWCMSMRALLLLPCEHALGLGLHLGNSLHRRERTSAHTQIAELPKIKRQLIPVLNNTQTFST